MQGRPSIAVLCAVALSGSAWSANYIYDFVADSTGPAQSFGPPTINSTGNVVMHVNMDLGGEHIYRGTSVPLDIIAMTGPAGGGQFSTFGNVLGMNDSGLVVFTATLPGGTQTIYTDSGGPSTLILSTFGQFSSFSAPVINNAGQVAFNGTLVAPPSAGVYRVTPGVGVAVIGQTTGPYASFQGDLAISVDGYALFRATLDDGEVGVFLGNGESTETIVSTNESDYTGFNAHAMSPNGVIAYAATHPDGSHAVYMIPEHDKPPVVIAHSAGVFSEFLSVAVNDDQEVAFLAVADEGGKAGIYTGCDPDTDAVVAVGDVVGGDEIVGLVVGPRSISTNGHVAFVAFLEDGERALYVAIPLPSLPGGPPPPPPPPGIPGDLDDDGDVDGLDLANLLAAWGKCPPGSKSLPCLPATDSCPGDLDDNGAVGGIDLAMLLGKWTGTGGGG